MCRQIEWLTNWAKSIQLTAKINGIKFISSIKRLWEMNFRHNSVNQFGTGEILFDIDWLIARISRFIWEKNSLKSLREQRPIFEFTEFNENQPTKRTNKQRTLTKNKNLVRILKTLWIYINVYVSLYLSYVGNASTSYIWDPCKPRSVAETWTYLPPSPVKSLQSN